jgi:replicative superfamily II helicase
MSVGQMMDLNFDRYKDKDGKMQILDHGFVIKKLLELPKTCDSVVASLYLRDHYDTFYRTVSHQPGARTDIMPMIAYSEAEDTFETSYMRERMARYRKSGVLATFGIAWDRFLLLPKEYCDALIEESEFAMDEKASEAKKMENELNIGKP